MKALSVAIGATLFIFNFSNAFADNTKLEDMSLRSFSKESSRLAKECKNADEGRRNQLVILLSDYINEVEYRCSKVNSKMPDYSSCKLTLFRLKSDFLTCEEKDYYERKVQIYLRNKI